MSSTIKRSSQPASTRENARLRMRAPIIAGAVAFTVIELLIILVVLGIVATLVVPQFTSASANAADAQLLTDLKDLRTAIQLYRTQHGRPPDADRCADQLTNFTDLHGGTSAIKIGGYHFGPYLPYIPSLPAGAQRGNRAISGTGFRPGCGWIYDAATGDITANAAPGDADASGKAYLAY